MELTIKTWITTKNKVPVIKTGSRHNRNIHKEMENSEKQSSSNKNKLAS
jgi:hypothetical protein